MYMYVVRVVYVRGKCADVCVMCVYVCDVCMYVMCACTHVR